MVEITPWFKELLPDLFREKGIFFYNGWSIGLGKSIGNLDVVVGIMETVNPFKEKYTSQYGVAI